MLKKPTKKVKASLGFAQLQGWSVPSKAKSMMFTKVAVILKYLKDRVWRGEFITPCLALL